MCGIILHVGGASRNQGELNVEGERISGGEKGVK
jgi:hypothetical protein